MTTVIPQQMPTHQGKSYASWTAEDIDAVFEFHWQDGCLSCSRSTLEDDELYHDRYLSPDEALAMAQKFDLRFSNGQPVTEALSTAR